MISRRLLDDRVGPRQRGAVRQLDDDDRIALVERRDEAARHRLHHVDRGVDEAGENGQHGDDRYPRADQHANDARIPVGEPVEAAIEAVGERPPEPRQEEARRRRRRVVRLEQQRGERRRKRQRIERRDRRRHRDGDRELQVELAGNAGDEGRRHEHGDQHQRDRDDRRPDLVHGQMRRRIGRQPSGDVALDILDHDDRIVDDDADRQNEAEQRQHVEREAGGVEHRQRADQRNRDRHDRHDRHAPRLQEDDDDDDDQQHRLEDGLVDLLDRLGDELGRIVDDVVAQPLREVAGQLLHLVLDLRRPRRAHWCPAAGRWRAPPPACR